MLIELPGKRDPDRAVVVHADTIGAMVRAIRPAGRLDLVPIGTWSARFAEGGRVTVFTEEPAGILTGTALPCQASGHAFGEQNDKQPANWVHPEVRLAVSAPQIRHPRSKE